MWEEAEETSSGDGQGLVLPLMDGLRNGPYRICHTASGDVLMCYRGGLATAALLQQVASRSERGESGNRIDGMSKSRQEYLNSEIFRCTKRQKNKGGDRTTLNSTRQ